MKITVVIVSYNVRAYLMLTLDSLYKALEGVESEVYVVDNHSRDDSVEMVRKHFPSTHVVANIHNIGFARANNIAIRKSKSDLVLLLNPDTVVGEETIKAGIALMQSDEHIGALGCDMLDIHGFNAPESRRGIPSPLTSFYKITGLTNRFPDNPRFNRYYMGNLPWDKPARIEIVSGAFCMLRRKALDECGLLDEDFFMYGEDIDLSYRILKGGYHNMYIPQQMLHFKGESTNHSSFRYVHVFYQAMLLFFKKHYNHYGILLSLPIKTAIYGSAFLALINIQLKNIRKSLGFTKRYVSNSDKYIFVSTAEGLTKCREIATTYNISAEYIESDGKSYPQINRSDDSTIVFDTSLFSYSRILRFFSANPANSLSMAFYMPQHLTVITSGDVFSLL